MNTELTVEREDVTLALGEMHMTILGLQREVRRLQREIEQRDAEQVKRDGAVRCVQEALSS